MSEGTEINYFTKVLMTEGGEINYFTKELMPECGEINSFAKELIQKMFLGSAKGMIRGKLKSKNSSSPRVL